MTTARARLQAVQDSMARACDAAQRDPASVTLVAVSKQMPAEALVMMAEAGVRHFGENRPEEAAVKIPRVNALWGGPPLVWHMVGHVQSRKVRTVAALFDWVHSVDSVPLAHRLAAAAQQAGRTPLNVFVQVNISGEASKYGLAGHDWRSTPGTLAALRQVVHEVAHTPGLALHGLMTVAPYQAPDDVLRALFHDVAALRDTLAAQTQRPLPCLSMGMTDDYPLALAAGATHIRVGRALFGERA